MRHVSGNKIWLLSVMGAFTMLSSCGDLPGFNISEQEQNFLIKSQEKFDFLFVIDNSGSMDDEREALKTNFGAFIDAFDEGGNENLKPHIGVITTDASNPYPGYATSSDCLNTADWWNSKAGNTHIGGSDKCALDVSTGEDPYIDLVSSLSLSAGKLISRYPTDLFLNRDSISGILDFKEMFKKNIDFENSGNGFETPLRSILSFMADSSGWNDSFLRDDAKLVVIVATDEDEHEVAQAPTPNLEFCKNLLYGRNGDTLSATDVGVDIDSDSNGSTDDAAEESALVDNVIDTLLNAKNGDNSQIQFFTINSEVNSTWTNGCALPAGGVEAITLKKVIDDTRSKFLLGESKDIAGDFSNLLGEIVTSVLESTPLELPQKVNTTEEELNVWFDGQLQPQINESLDPSLWQGWRYVEETIGSETKYRIYFYDVDGENDNLLKAGVNVTVKYVPKESTS